MKFLSLLLLVGCAGAPLSPSSSDVEAECKRLVADLAAARDAGDACVPSRARVLAAHHTCKLALHECPDGGR